MHAAQLTEHEIGQVVDFMRRASGNDCAEKAPMVNSKMGMLCVQAGYERFRDLWNAMQGNGIEAAQLRQRVIDELTTNYTYFYREHAHFATLSKLIASGALPVDGASLRVWSAGCASGEEAYNIAMALEDDKRAGAFVGAYNIVGSDISSRAIEAAQAGRYDMADIARMPSHWRTFYCMRSGQAFEVKALVRKHVEFRRENALLPRPDRPFDVVMCRNMIIYLDRPSIERFCTILRRRVKPGGYLFLGHAEILGAIPGFTYLEPSLWRRDGAATGANP